MKCVYGPKEIKAIVKRTIGQWFGSGSDFYTRHMVYYFHTSQERDRACRALNELNDYRIKVVRFNGFCPFGPI